jgi:predicted dehydrogenase
VLEGVVIGAGNRGAEAYVPYLSAHPDEARIVAVAEPDPARRAAFARRHGLPADTCHDDYASLLAGPRRADFALVATGDDLHVEPALLALERGYHVLLEKPMATREAACRTLVDAAERSGRILQVCHVLRYAPLFAAVHRRVRAGEIGRVVAIQHAENVAYWHYAHSYCRGHWRNQAASSPLILAKSCHDLDLLYWIAGADPESLSSLARPTELTAANRPAGAPERCIDGCRHAARCPYDAVATYLEARPIAQDVAQTAAKDPSGVALRAIVAARARLAGSGLPGLAEAARWRAWPVSTITRDTSRAGVERALRETRYGRCVYAVGDNDQPSAQTVEVRFANDVLASFTLHGHSHREGRTIRVDGTEGSLVGRFHLMEQILERHDHKSGRVGIERFPMRGSGHGDGDHRLFAGFLAAIRGEAEPLTSARESLVSHLMAFAAHRSSLGAGRMTFRGGAFVGDRDADAGHPAARATDPARGSSI